MRRPRRMLFLLAAAAGLLAPAAAVAQTRQAPAKNPKIEDTVDIINNNPQFQVQISVDHADARYIEDELLSAKVVSSRAGYVYVFFRGADNKWLTMYPHDKAPNNAIQANVPLDIPGPGKQIRIVGKEFGVELIKVVVTTEKVDLNAAVQEFAKGIFTQVEPKLPLAIVRDVLRKGGARNPQMENKPANVTLEDPKLGAGWAEATLQYVTGPKNQGKPDVEVTPLPGPGKPDPAPIAPQPGKARRVGAFIGFKDYKKFGRASGAGDIPSLTVCDQDAKRFAEVAKQQFRLDDVVVLVNADATYAAIQKLIAVDLPGATRAGDLVTIFWSGHGGQCANTTPGTEGPFRQYLMPYDGDLESPETTMVMNNAFARWMQNLEGRKCVLIFDTCHAGGLTADPVKGAKSAPIRNMAGGIKGAKPRFFMEFEMSTMKNLRGKCIKQHDVFILASSEADKASFERDDGKGSVMTYTLIEYLNATSGKIAAKDLYDAVKVKVPAYVADKIRGATQTPVYGGAVTDPPLLRE